MLQQENRHDYIVASGETHKCVSSARLLRSPGMDYETYVVSDPAFLRPAEVDLLHGDSTKARTVLGWEPKVHFRDLVEMMVDSDMARLSR